MSRNTFSTTTLDLLCKQFAHEEGWDWETLSETNHEDKIDFYTMPWSRTHIRKQIFQLLNSLIPETSAENNNYYETCTKELGSTIAINEELITRYFQENNLDGILSVFNFLNRCRERAETLSRYYFQIKHPPQKLITNKKSKLETIQLENLNF